VPQSRGVAGQLFQTSGIDALPPADQSAIREKVETFSAFTPDNDPHGERDFGAFEHNGNRIFWKIDCYDRTLTWGSEDPSDPSQTVRVLTIMLASEYTSISKRQKRPGRLRAHSTSYGVATVSV
jgi:hypothetical protein